MDAGQGSGQLRVSHSGSDNPAGPGAAVDLCVFGEVVAAGKLLLTQRALVRLDARVRAAVTRQFVGAGEPGDKSRGVVLSTARRRFRDTPANRGGGKN